MKNTLLQLRTLILGGLLLASGAHWVQAQSSSEYASGQLPWFAMHNNTLVVQTGNKAKPLTKDVTLPNGTRVEYATQSVVLTDGKRVPMQEGDMLSLNGEFIRNQTAAPVAKAIASAPATAPASIPAPAPAEAPKPAPAAPPTFAYRPAAPVNGKLRGVVELGASGFNLFIIRMDEKRNWKLEKSEFGNSLVLENMATEADISKGLKAYIGQMLDYGVAGRDIHFVVSSGAAMGEGTQKIIKGLQAMKYVVTPVTPKREGELGLLAAMPAGYAGRAFVVDMGSGNTKIAWQDKGQPRVLDSYGAKYYEMNVDAATAAADVQAKAAQVPAQLRQTCFIIGGVPYELAKAGRQGKEPYTVLRAPEAYPEPAAAKAKAGLNIYQAVAAATGCREFVFGYDANFTIGYLLALP
ncbi:hypothetical protein MUN81_13920 [Hymenobacter sp. 5317J-9]|uniref:DUF6799 domain-containing protein n=1 Tax=Hymenobacter sp. 5317J-9 TaxID=2932250 RepID=UPI001FD6AAA1|nr:DUF6799 domain-containing protein [Hymenobacter sp. 5317J-9]UOQ96346.1 hypothetical protein MUN81_13920 [Hymenobacter sp. 5317J-9]